MGMFLDSSTPPAWLSEQISQHIAGLQSKAIPLLTLAAAATILHCLGLIDDRRGLGPYIKLLLQLAAALLLVTVGQIRFDFFIANEYISATLSVLWIVVIINAFNFLDNMDGLSAGVAVIVAGIIMGAAWSNGQVFISSFLALVIGALLGFLVFNFVPAKIFMGDAGSLLVGLFIAVGSIKTTYYHADGGGAWYAALMPLIALAVPLYDFTSVVIIRILQGKSPLIGDKQHFSHRLVKRGMSQRQAVLTIYLATACTGLGATILHQVSVGGMIMIFIQTILILLIIAILEQQ